MKILIPLVLIAFLGIPAVFYSIGSEPAGDPSATAGIAAERPGKRLPRFGSEAELKGFLRKLTKRRKAADGASVDKYKSPSVPSTGQPMAPAPSPSAKTANMSAGSIAASDVKADKDESVTNVQHAGVDEGGIVKVHGSHLVVLRRGRLFTIAVGDNMLKPISTVNAYGPGIDPEGTWYDEMLVSDDTIIVIGYSYERGGTEVGLFQIDSGGALKYRSTYHLRSDDYYSSRNYSSRLVDGKLIFYSPLYLFEDEDNPLKSFPAVRRWHKGARESEFRRIADATDVYRSREDLDAGDDLALHTVTVCNLDGGEMSCKATVVIGPPGDVFYVSPKSVYVWASNWDYSSEESKSRSTLFKLPLDGSGPSAVRVAGSPVDQFSFLETDDEQLNVVVRSDGGGDNMWNAEVADGDVALLKLNPRSFTDGRSEAPASSYRALPKPAGSTFQNRFVGDYLLYGTGSGWDQPEKISAGTLYTLGLDGGDVAEVKLPHGVDRIEALGGNAIVVGSDGRDLHFSTVRLGSRPAAVDEYVLKDASQGELRSHGFFYKPQDEKSGMLGLPVTVGSRPGYKHLTEGSASIIFLRNDSLRLKGLGELAAKDEGFANDGCLASCVDWYGNARPLFLQGRVFALLGYEIVEGSVQGGGITETRRVNYAPKAMAKIER